MVSGVLQQRQQRRATVCCLGHEARYSSGIWLLSGGSRSASAWRGELKVFQGHLSGGGAAVQPGLVVVFERGERDEFCAAPCILCSGPEETGSEGTSTDEGCPRNVRWASEWRGQAAAFGATASLSGAALRCSNGVVRQRPTRAYIKSIDTHACCTQPDLWFYIFLATRV
jgi:hypothetical protein